jgi:hypothetical protein
MGGTIMKTLVVYYSKTGTTKKVAEAVIAKKRCDYDELQYEEKTKAMRYARDPSEYERIILLAPVWGFALAAPMKQYIAMHKTNIKRYDLVVTCGSWGLRGCIKNCLSSIGTPPENALKFRTGQVNQNKYDLSAIL